MLISIAVDPFYGGFIACNMMFILVAMIIWDIPMPSGNLVTEEKLIEVTRHSVLFGSVLFSLSFSFMISPLNVPGATVGFLVGTIVFFILAYMVDVDVHRFVQI